MFAVSNTEYESMIDYYTNRVIRALETSVQESKLRPHISCWNNTIAIEADFPYQIRFTYNFCPGFGIDMYMSAGAGHPRIEDGTMEWKSDDINEVRPRFREMIRTYYKRAWGR